VRKIRKAYLFQNYRFCLVQKN